MKLDLTRTGINYLLQSLAGGSPPVFTSIVLGNGADAGGEDATQVSNPLVTIGINSIERDNEFVTLSGVLNNNDIASEFRANEMGVFIQNPDNEGKELLFAYGYVTDKKAMLVPSITDHLFETTENVMVYVGSAENVSAVLTESLATVSKAEFKAHTESKGNPHNVSKEDVGLDNVPNVSTNDQTPTYTAPEELTELTSGEKLSVLLGKVAKGISSLIAHLKDFNNPHKVTLEQLEAAPATHQHSTNDITSGILGLARGGLGADNAEDARKNIGAAASAHTHTVDDLVGGTLDVEHGGTGANNAADALANLGALPLSGGVMTGLLTLSADPTSNMHAVTKKYVDANANKITLLWSNAAAESEFSTQTVKISTLANYKFIIISFWTRSGYRSDFYQGEASAIFENRSSYAFDAGGGAIAIHSSLEDASFIGYPEIVFRPVKIHYDYINFGGGYTLNQNSTCYFDGNNYAMVPRRIYGVKI